MDEPLPGHSFILEDISELTDEEMRELTAAIHATEDVRELSGYQKIPWLFTAADHKGWPLMHDSVWALLVEEARRRGVAPF